MVSGTISRAPTRLALPITENKMVPDTISPPFPPRATGSDTVSLTPFPVRANGLSLPLAFVTLCLHDRQERPVMRATFEEIAADAMRLPPRDRVKLAQRLVSTLDPGVEKDVEGLWLVEAERRLEELRTGKAKGIDAPEAFRKAHEALKR